jgi:TonB family protein
MRRSHRLWIGTVNAVALLISSSVSAKMETVTCEYKYVLGDNVTKHDARKIAFVEAKRRCAEQIGTLLTSETVVSLSDLTKDEIRTYSLAVMKTEVVSESFLPSGDSLAVLIKLKAHYDSELVGGRVKELLNDRGRIQELKQAQEQIVALEMQMASLQRQLSVASSDERQVLQRERRLLENERQRLTTERQRERETQALSTLDGNAARNTREKAQERRGTSARFLSLADDVAKELDEELRKIKTLEVPKAATPMDTPSKPAPYVEAKTQSAKAVDNTLKVPGMAPGSNAYLALVRQRISNSWNAPPIDLTNQAYVVVVRFRLHKNGLVTGVTIEQSSGNQYYDLAGKRAVLTANPLPVFPADFTDPYFDAYFTFTVGSTEESVSFP